MTRQVPMLTLIGTSVVSQLGDKISIVAIPWFVLQSTGSAVSAGLTASASLLPAILATALGGPIVDRAGFKRISVIADVASAITTAAIPLLYATIGLDFWQLLVFVFLGSLFDAPGRAGRVSLVPNVAVPAGWSLERANGTMQATSSFVSLVGPVAAGALIAVFGTTNSLWLNAGSYVVSAIGLALAVPSVQKTQHAEMSYLLQIREGWSYLHRHSLIFALAATSAVLNFMMVPLGNVLLPVYAATILSDPRALGVMYSALGGGLFLGSTVFAAIGDRLPGKAVLVVAYVGAGLPMWVLAAEFSLLPIVIVLFLTGCAISPIDPVVTTYLQEQVPDSLRGRVISAFIAIGSVATPLGALVGGVLAETVGYSTTALLLGPGLLLVGLSVLVNPAFRNLATTSVPATRK